MAEISYRRHRFPPVVIQHAVWLYLRFTLSYRAVEALLAERGLAISYQRVSSRVLKFGPAIARGLRRCRPRPSDRCHLDEMVVRIAGQPVDKAMDDFARRACLGRNSFRALFPHHLSPLSRWLVGRGFRSLHIRVSSDR